MATVRSVEQLRCPRCGAPLIWKGDVSVVECNYCRTHVVVETGQQTRAPAGAVARKPVPSIVWLLVIGGAFGAVVLVSIVAFVSTVASKSTSPLAAASGGATAAEIAATPLAATPEQIAKRFGVEVHNTSVHVPMHDKIFESAHFNWDQQHLGHISSISLSYPGDEPPAPVLERAKTQLGRLLRGASTGGYQYNGERVNLSFGSTVSINAHTFDDPRWQERLAALWTVLKFAALNASEQLDMATKRDVLNIDNPLERISNVRFDVEVDGAELEVHRVLPGAVSQKERHDVGLGHPWFESAMLVWENKAGGKWSQLNLYYPKEFSFKAQRNELERCLSGVLGEAKVTVRDHLAGDVTLTYDAKDGFPYLHAGDQAVLILLRDRRAPVTAEGLEKLLKSLASCG